ncbi:MAG: metalloregulator ArsR/SmtB family transcription factor [Candidatus Eremiobacteraeota bacterium]|nr:metalloregulator ArsR/SmtB family transcription factor [Candidatus Eremiobacteraeota bacterium]
MVNSTPLDQVFGALADPTRRRIVERLSRGPRTVGEIAGEFPISQPAISRHIRILEDCGLLEREIVGRVHRCTLSPGAIKSASEWLERQRSYWNKTLDRLESILTNPSPKRK